jgi:hypothetical protein
LERNNKTFLAVIMEKHFRLPSFLAVLVFVIIFSINFGGIDSLCLVEERSSKEAKPCIFPFIFADKVKNPQFLRLLFQKVVPFDIYKYYLQ